MAANRILLASERRGSLHDLAPGLQGGGAGGQGPAACPPDIVEKALRLSGTGVWQCDLASDALAWTDSVFDLFALPPGTAISRGDILAMYDPVSRAQLDRLRAEAIARRQGFSIDARIRDAEGTEKWVRIHAGVLVSNGRAATLYGTKQDVTGQFEAWEAMRHLAERDSLTGLASRALFQAQFLDPPREAPELAPLGTLILIDVDGFKGVNDGHGHAAGDACLQAVAGQLMRAFDEAAMIARIGGDEFAILLPAGIPMRRIEARLADLLRRIAAPLLWKSSWLSVTASAGVAAVPDPWSYDAERLFHDADAALYRAKRGGRNGFRTADPDQ